MKTINIKCPFCEEQIILSLNQDFEVVSVKLEDVELISNEDIEELLEKHGIEFG